MGATYVVFNPVAGTEAPEAVRSAIERHFDRAEIPYEIYRTSGEENLIDVVSAACARDFDCFVAAGGDGTVSGVVSGLVKTGHPLGILPTGTGNVLARELGIPLDLEAALALVTGEHALRPIDVMQVEQRFFVLSVSMGLSALMMQETARGQKRRLGMLAYLLTGVRKLLGFHQRRFTLEVDGQTQHHRATEVNIANSGAIGMPALRWEPGIRLDDGQLDVCLLRARTLLDYAIIAANIVWRRERRTPHIRCFQAHQQVVIRAEEALPVQADGDVIGRQTVRVQLAPQALSVIVPRR